MIRVNLSRLIASETTVRNGKNGLKWKKMHLKNPWWQHFESSYSREQKETDSLGDWLCFMQRSPVPSFLDWVNIPRVNL